MRHLILGVEQSLDRLGISLTEAVQLVGLEIDEVLSGRQLAINELGAEVAKQIAGQLPLKQRDLSGRSTRRRPVDR